MAASTITRATWTDGVGGTTINNALKNTDIYDKIDEMFAGAGAYATFTLGGLLAVEGFGTHSFNASGTGAQVLQVRHTSAGTANASSIQVGNDTLANLGRFQAFSSTYTETGDIFQDGVRVAAFGAGGLSLTADHASGAVRLYAAGTTKLATFDGDRTIYSGGSAGPYSPVAALRDSRNTTAVGTDANTTEKDLHTYSLPASTLATNLDMVRYYAAGTFAANGNTKRIRAYFGSTVIVDSTAIAGNGTHWALMATIVRTGAATQKAVGMFWPDFANFNDWTVYATPTETLSGAVTIKTTGLNGTASANDAVCEMSHAELVG